MAGGRTSVRDRIKDVSVDREALLLLADAIDDFRDEVLKELARTNWLYRFVLGGMVTMMGVIVAVTR